MYTLNFGVTNRPGRWNGLDSGGGCCEAVKGAELSNASSTPDDGSKRGCRAESPAAVTLVLGHGVKKTRSIGGQFSLLQRAIAKLPTKAHPVGLFPGGKENIETITHPQAHQCSRRESRRLSFVSSDAASSTTDSPLSGLFVSPFIQTTKRSTIITYVLLLLPGALHA